jgi:hypothetical protein
MSPDTWPTLIHVLHSGLQYGCDLTPTRPSEARCERWIAPGLGRTSWDVLRSHNGGFTRALMEVHVVDDHTGSDAWVVHSVAVGVRGTSSSFSLSPRLVRGVGSLGLPQHTDAVWLNTQLQTRTWYNRDQHTKIHSLLYIFFLLGVAEYIMCL